MNPGVPTILRPFVFILMFALIINVGVAPVPAHALTLAEAIQRSWGYAPLLKAQLDAQRRLYQLSQFDRVRRFLPNEPQLQLARNDDRTAEVISLNETMGFPGKGFALARLDTARSLSQQAELESRKYDIAKQTTQIYLDCASSIASVDLLKTSLEDLQTLARSLRVRYESGVATLAENIGTELQLRQQRTDLAAAQDKAAGSCQRLHTLLHLQPMTAVTYELPDDLDERLLKELSPLTSDENRSQAVQRLAQATLKTAVWAQLPDITLSAAKNYYVFLPGSPSGKGVTYNYGVSLTAPALFPFYAFTETKRTRSQALSDQAVAQVQWLLAHADRVDAAKEYRRSQKRLRELRENDLSMAQALMESTYSAYKTGKLGFAELVLARKTLLDLKTQDIQLRGSVVSAHLRCLQTCEAQETSNGHP